MVKIVMVGAASAGFCRLLVQDILCFESTSNAHIMLMDVDSERLDVTHRVMNNMAQQNKLSCKFSSSTNLTEALQDADFAISMIQVGGLEPYEFDISIPLKYGVEQCIGDTIGPGGIFRGLRHVPALLEMLRTAEKVARDDLIFMNYANPMAISTWAMLKEFPGITSVGLCHGVQHTTQMLCQWLEVDPTECDVLTAGINHMAWFLTFKHKGKDLYPVIWEKLDREGLVLGEEYRFEMMKAVGYFMTESSGHLSEYLPYFRKRKDIQELFCGSDYAEDIGSYLKLCQKGLDQYHREMAEQAQGKTPVPYEPNQKSVEYAADIINAKLTGTQFRFAGNTLNKEFIENLPYDCCVEVPVFVDKMGLHGSFVGNLPPQCAALCRTNINVQELAVEAAVKGDFEAAFHACLLDPLTSAVLAPPSQYLSYQGIVILA